MKNDAVNPNGAGGLQKGFWRSQISQLFLIHYLENQKKNWGFSVFWGDLEGAG